MLAGGGSLYDYGFLAVTMGGLCGLQELGSPTSATFHTCDPGQVSSTLSLFLHL